MKKTGIFISVFSVFLLLSSCATKKGASTTGKGKDCAEGIMCTEVFEKVALKVTDAKGNQVSLDEFYVINEATKALVRPDGDLNNAYVVLDDGYKNELKNKKATYRAIGKKNGKTVIDAQYVIGADCCHIYKVSGPDKLVINK